MFGRSDPRWGEAPEKGYEGDPRDRDEDDRGSTINGTDPREQGDWYEREIERDHGWDPINSSRFSSASDHADRGLWKCATSTAIPLVAESSRHNPAVGMMPLMPRAA